MQAELVEPSNTSLRHTTSTSNTTSAQGTDLGRRNYKGRALPQRRSFSAHPFEAML